MKVNKRIVVVAILVVIVLAMVIVPKSGNESGQETPKSNEVSSVEQDLVYDLLKDIANEVGIRDYGIKETEVTWTARTVNLTLSKGKTFYIQESFNWADIEAYFNNNGWKTESMGWTYVSENGSDSIGYMPSKVDHKFDKAMCILKVGGSEIQCGLGP